MTTSEEGFYSKKESSSRHQRKLVDNIVSWAHIQYHVSTGSYIRK